MAKIGELIVSIVGDNSSLTRSLDQSSKQVDSFGTSIANGLASVVSFAAIAAAAVRGIEFNKAAEQAQVSFEVMTGSAETATRVLAELREFANSTPLEFKDIRDATQTMISFGISANDSVKYIKMLGDISGGNADKLRSISLAFSQIQSTGRLMGQDLLQLINAGFNPLQEMSEQTGKSMAELKKEMENGAISADMVTAAFESATSAGGRFNGMLERQGQTLAGAQSTMNDALDTFLGEATKGLTGPLIDAFRVITDGLGKLGDNFASIGDMFGGIAIIITKGLQIIFDILNLIPGPILAIVSAIAVAKIAMIGLSAAASTLGITMSSALGPVGILIAAIAGGIGLAVSEADKAAKKTTESFSGLAKSLGTTNEEAQRLQGAAIALGVPIAEIQRLLFTGKSSDFNLIEKISKDLRTTNVPAENLAKTIDVLAKKYGITRELIVDILDKNGKLSSDQLSTLRRITAGQDASIKLEYEKNKAIKEGSEQARKDSVAVSKENEERQKAQKIIDDAAAKAKADASAAELKRIEQERINARKALDDFLMSEEQKLLAEKARYLSAAKNAEEVAKIEEFYAIKIAELKTRAAEEKQALEDKQLLDNEKAVRKELEGIEITTEEELKAAKDIVNGAELSADQQKKLNDEITANFEENVEKQKKAISSLANYIGDTLGSLADSIAELNDANLKTQLDKIDQETQAQLEAAGLKEETEVQRLERELQAAVLAGDTELAAERKRDLERQKILDNAKKKAAKAEYEAAMNAWNLKYTMAIVDAAVAVISIWAGTGTIYEKIAGSVVAVVATAASIATIEANKPQPPALYTGTTNPIGEAGTFLVGDQGPELVSLPRGSTVRNNRDTMEALGGQQQGVTATIQVMLDRQMIGQSTVDLINNGLIVVEAFA